MTSSYRFKSTQMQKIKSRNKNILVMLLNILNLNRDNKAEQYHLNEVSEHLKKDIGAQFQEEVETRHYSNYL